MEDPLALQLPSDIREATDRAQFERVEEIVEACRQRDEELRDLRRQNEGEPASTVGPYPGSCDMEDSISRELHTTLVAPSRQAIRYPYYLIDPIDPADEDAARRVEQWFNPRLRQCGFKTAVDRCIYTALESRYAPLVISYRRLYQKIRRLWYRDLETDEVVAPDERQPDRTYKPQMMLDNGNALYDGLHFRTPLPWNVYPWPAGAISFSADEDEGALAVIERMYLSREDLLLGVKSQGYDRDAVRDMLARGPGRMSDEAREEMLARDGIQSERADGYYECYQILGRIPYIVDGLGDLETPEDLMHEDFVWLVCPNANTVLKRAFSPDPIRPYVRLVAYDIPGSFLGHGILSLTRTLQEEMTAMLRLAVDTLSLAAAPPFMIPEQHLNRFGDVVFGPGRTIAIPTGMARLEQAVVDKVGPTMALQFLNHFYGRAMQISAAQGVNNNMQGKVRKEAEVEFTQQTLQTKFNLIVSNLQIGMEEAAHIMLPLLLSNMDGDEQMYADHQTVSIAPADLDRRYRFLPQVSSDNVNEQARVERDLNLYRVISASPLYQMRLASGDLSGEYHLMKRLAEDMGERDPETLLGPEPQPPMPGMAGGMPGQMNPMQMNPMALLQPQALMQQAQEQGASAQPMGAPKSNGSKPGS